MGTHPLSNSRSRVPRQLGRPCRLTKRDRRFDAALDKGSRASIGLRSLGVVDDEDVHAVARRLELETKLLPKGCEHRRPFRPARAVDAQIIGHPLHFPVDFPVSPV